ncbi:MAG: polysaccharide deacetylase family protein [Desulfobacterales bacterium]
MKRLVIHDLRPEYFALPLDGWALTFDDGLFSHYYYLPLLQRFPGPLLFFLPTSLIGEGPARERFDGRFLPYRSPAEYARDAFLRGKREAFLTVEEARFLARQEGVRLGAHSHFHAVGLTDIAPRRPRPVSPWKLELLAGIPPELRRGLSIRSRLAFAGFTEEGGRLRRRSEAEWRADIRRDTECCLEWFERFLGFRPEAYAFPFNEYSPVLIEELERLGFREFYGPSRPKDPRVRARIDIEELLAPPPEPAAKTPGGMDEAR